MAVDSLSFSRATLFPSVTNWIIIGSSTIGSHFTTCSEWFTLMDDIGLVAYDTLCRDCWYCMLYNVRVAFIWDHMPMNAQPMTDLTVDVTQKS